MASTPYPAFFELPPRRVAVVLVDFQNDFCSPEVFHGGPVTNTNNAAAALRANSFASEAAGVGAKIVYTRQVLDFAQLTQRQQRWERPDGLCAKGTWGAELYAQPIPGSRVVTKYRFDCWQSADFVGALEEDDVDGLIICGVELVCCVLYAVLGAEERGYHYLVAQDLVSGQDPGDDTDNKAVRDFLRHNQPERVVDSAEIIRRWQQEH
jgi:nicotinamidase-related amidase